MEDISDDIAPKSATPSSPRQMCSSSGALRDDPALFSPPQGWPGAFKSNAELKAFLLTLKAKRVRVVSVPSAAAVQEMTTVLANAPDSSDAGNFERADRIQRLLGWPIIAGFALFQQRKLAANERDVYTGVERWWNAMPNGTWVDTTPRTDADKDTVLLESPLCVRPGPGGSTASAPTTATATAPTSASTTKSALKSAGKSATAPTGPRYARLAMTRKTGFDDGFGSQVRSTSAVSGARERPSCQSDCFGDGSVRLRAARPAAPESTPSIAAPHQPSSTLPPLPAPPLHPAPPSSPPPLIAPPLAVWPPPCCFRSAPLAPVTGSSSVS